MSCLIGLYSFFLFLFVTFSVFLELELLNDGKENILDFKNFIIKSQHPDIKKYQDLNLFKKFNLEYGELNGMIMIWLSLCMIYIEVKSNIKGSVYSTLEL